MAEKARKKNPMRSTTLSTIGMASYSEAMIFLMPVKKRSERSGRSARAVRR